MTSVARAAGPLPRAGDDRCDSLLVEPAFADSALGRSLLEKPLGFIDIGARGGVSAVVRPIAAATAVLAFEPDAEEAGRLRAAHAAAPAWNRFEVEAAAVAGSRGERDFFELARPVNSSLLRPSEPFARRYQVPGFAIEKISRCRTDTLDNVVFARDAAEPAFGEFIKLDAQGAELEILRGADRLLADRTVAIVAEVSFCELYEGQPLFGDVAAYLQTRGFSFYGFHASSHRASHLRHLVGSAGPSWSQRLLHADAVFFRDDAFGPVCGPAAPRRRHALTCVALLLGHYDTAIELTADTADGDGSPLAGLIETLATR
ncbi:FkbM family methyltransferase [bacterium]|nr:FkbM family methyltransferase [bacterium]